jgi:hypothetical protein
MAMCDELAQRLTNVQIRRTQLLEAILHEALSEGRSPEAVATTSPM